MGFEMATIDDVMNKLDDVLSKIDDCMEKADEAKAEAIAAKSAVENLEMYSHAMCTLCQGTGEINDPVDGVPGPPYSCPKCSGDGSIRFVHINQEAGEWEV